MTAALVGQLDHLADLPARLGAGLKPSGRVVGVCVSGAGERLLPAILPALPIVHDEADPVETVGIHGESVGRLTCRIRSECEARDRCRLLVVSVLLFDLASQQVVALAVLGLRPLLARQRAGDRATGRGWPEEHLRSAARQTLVHPIERDLAQLELQLATVRAQRSRRGRVDAALDELDAALRDGDAGMRQLRARAHRHPRRAASPEDLGRLAFRIRRRDDLVELPRGIVRIGSRERDRKAGDGSAFGVPCSRRELNAIAGDRGATVRGEVEHVGGGLFLFKLYSAAQDGCVPDETAKKIRPRLRRRHLERAAEETFRHRKRGARSLLAALAPERQRDALDGFHRLLAREHHAPESDRVPGAVDGPIEIQVPPVELGPDLREGRVPLFHADVDHGLAPVRSASQGLKSVDLPDSLRWKYREPIRPGHDVARADA